MYCVDCALVASPNAQPISYEPAAGRSIRNVKGEAAAAKLIPATLAFTVVERSRVEGEAGEPVHPKVIPFRVCG